MDFLPPDVKRPVEAPRKPVEAVPDAEALERSYLGTLMGWKPDCRRVETGVDYKHFTSPIRADLLHVLRDSHPWGDRLELGSLVTETLGTRYGFGIASGEVIACAVAARPWQELGLIAQKVVAGWEEKQ